MFGRDLRATAGMAGVPEAAPFAERKRIVRPVPLKAHDASSDQGALATATLLEIVHAIVTRACRSGVPAMSVADIIPYEVDSGDSDVLPQVAGKKHLLGHRSPCPAARPGCSGSRPGPAPPGFAARGGRAATRRA